jgi:hypothetical protein
MDFQAFLRGVALFAQKLRTEDGVAHESLHHADVAFCNDEVRGNLKSATKIITGGQGANDDVVKVHALHQDDESASSFEVSGADISGCNENEGSDDYF